MTEAEWLRAPDPGPMLAAYEDRLSERKRRLFAVASCRTLFTATPSSARAEVVVFERVQPVLDAAERVADEWEGPPSSAAFEASLQIGEILAEQLRDRNFQELRWLQHVRDLFRHPDRVPRLYNTGRFLRDIFGNPFRPVAFDPAWRSEAASGIAAKMYDDRDFRAMPILADALEEAAATTPTS